MKKILCLILLCLCILTAYAQGAPYTFTDDTGIQISLPEAPRRVAVLFSSFADVWKCAGGEIAVTVGESIERGFADAGTILVDDGAGKTISTELLLAAEPDFVICSADIEAQVRAAELLNSAGIPAACFHVDTFDEYLNMLKICTDITGNPNAWQRCGLDVQARIEALRAAHSGEPDKRSILFIRAGSSASATKAKRARDHFAAAMLEELGTVNIADSAPVLLDGLSIEEVLRADPDFIFIATMGSAEAAMAHMDSVLAEPAWQALTAVQNGDYAYLPKDLFQFKPNARWDEAYAYLMDMIYDE